MENTKVYQGCFLAENEKFKSKPGTFLAENDTPELYQMANFETLNILTSL